MHTQRSLSVADTLQSRFLEGLTHSERNVVIGAASLRKFSNETVISNQGFPAEQLFLLVNGVARFFVITPNGHKMYLLWLRPGDILGAASLLRQPSFYLVNTEVTKLSEVFVWQAATIRQLARRYSRLLENTLMIANDYAAWFLASHVSLICHTARQRLANVIVSLARGIGQKDRNGIRLNITNEQLANTANVTVFTVSRLLNLWQKTGILIKQRNMLLLRAPERFSSSL